MRTYDRLRLGHIQQTWIDRDDDDFEFAIERSEDVSDLVRDLVTKYENSVKEGQRLAKELQDLKTRRYWDELDMVTDPRTGNTVVIRTHYEWAMKGMRLEISPETMAQSRLYQS